MTTAPTIYHYHPNTGEYLGAGIADPDPMTPVESEQEWLYPADSTLLAPDTAGQNETPVYRDDRWVNVADYRGTRYWLPDGSEHIIEHLGNRPPDDAVLERPADDGETERVGMTPAASRRLAITRIDTHAGEVRTAFASNGAFVAAEYEQARSAAQQWDAAGRPADDVPDDVQSWADATGNTAAWAADDIMQTAAGWSSVLSAIRAVRLNAKESIRRAPDDSDFDALAAPYLEQLAEIAARVPGSS